MFLLRNMINVSEKIKNNTLFLFLKHFENCITLVLHHN